MRGMLTVSRRHLANQQGVGGDRQIGSAGATQFHARYSV
jgi:hypothetical protein